MKIYSFWSADTTYFTISKSIKKTHAIGLYNYQLYLDNCKYLNEQVDLPLDYFIPTEIEIVTKEYFKKIVKEDKDILILDDKLYELLQ